jgi:hypothetical protein
MFISVLPDWRTSVPHQFDLSFKQFVEEVLLEGVQPFEGHLSGDYEEDKKGSLAVSPTEYPANTGRKKDNVISVSMMALDYDALTRKQMIAVLEAFEGAEYVVWSTFSHAHKARLREQAEEEAAELGIDSAEMPLTELFRRVGRDRKGERIEKTPTSKTNEPTKVTRSGCYSFRVFLPLSKPVPGSEWLPFWQRFQAILPVPSDPSCKDPSRIYGLPYTPPLDVSESFFEYAPGDILNVDALLALELPPEVRATIATPGQRAKHTSDSLDLKVVKQHGRSLQRKKYAEKVQLGTWIVAVADGEPWCREQGKRHELILPITAEIENKFPLTSIDTLTNIWERSVTAVHAEDPSWNSEEALNYVRRAYEGARRNRLARQDQARVAAEEAKTRAIAQARGDGKSKPYDADDMARIRELAGRPVGADMTKHWIRTLKDTHYVGGLDGYGSPWTSKDVMQVCRDRLPPAEIKTTQINDKGNETVIPTGTFMQEYSTPLAGIVADMTCPHGMSYVDEEDVMHEAACRVRDIEAVFDPLVDEYLTLMGGKHAEKFKDWLASFLDLSRQTCALYLKGPKGTGKTLIPTMLANMFVGRPSPTELESVLSNFNEDLARCPIVFADEEAKSGGMQELTSATLRKLIGSDKRSLKRKFLSNATLKGAIRLILSANNSTLLRFEKEEPTADDLDAVNERFLCITTTKEHEQWIADHGGQDLTKHWVEGAFESHIMWLHQNRKVVPGVRWLVAGEPSEVQSLTATSNEINSAVCQWICAYLNNPRKVEQVAPGTVQFDERGVWVNSTGMLKTFVDVVQNSNARATIENVGIALRALSRDKKDRTVMHGLKRTKLKFHLLKMELILDWAERNDYGDSEVLQLASTSPMSFSQQIAN